ncbi:unnamed protein product [Oppiella nova]|uniref:UBC core domain-containing protein n=1 Tax=Oppiella nova TaxID=334625 RepID=A0A7R9QR32_9ACAR|nr:unnamed protein product [Oppiella nova]CAG2170703.1 unnamed protein product [Oppiella nova]
MSSQVPLLASKRLKRDYKDLIQEPVPFVSAHPLDSNILEWHFVLRGPPDSPFTDGIYHGCAKFPKEFPYKPPSLRMFTPSGRFVPNERICMSMSEFHPESWSPLWTVGSVLNGLLSFMLSADRAMGTCVSSDAEKRDFAQKSWKFNLKNKIFCKLFPELAAEAMSKP